MHKLPKRYETSLTAAIMSLLMSLVISLILTWINKGSHGMNTWPVAWVQSFLVALPIAVLILPSVRQFVGLLVKKK